MGRDLATALILVSAILLSGGCGNGGPTQAPEIPNPAAEDAKSDPQTIEVEELDGVVHIRFGDETTWADLHQALRRARGRTIVFDGWEVADADAGEELEAADSAFPVSVRLLDTTRGSRLRYEFHDRGRLPPGGCDVEAPETRGEFDGWSGAGLEALVLRLEAIAAWRGGGLDLLSLQLAADHRGDTGNPPSAADVLGVKKRLDEAGATCVDVGPLGSIFESLLEDPTIDDGLKWLTHHAFRTPACGWDKAGTPRTDATFADAELRATSLALLAFLRHGYSNRGRHAFAKPVSRGLRALKKRQGVDGCYGDRGDGGMPLTHALGTLAMATAYDMTGSPIFKGSIQRALVFLQEAFAADTVDLGVISVCTLAVAQVRLTNDDARRRGKTPPLVEPLGLADDLQQALRGVGPDYVGVQLGGRLLLGAEGDDPEIQALVERALRQSREHDPTHADFAPWVTYVTALGMVRLSSETWTKWARASRPPLFAAQRRDGATACYRGSWDPATSELARDERVAMTALALMILAAEPERHVIYRVR